MNYRCKAPQNKGTRPMHHKTYFKVLNNYIELSLKDNLRNDFEISFF